MKVSDLADLITVRNFLYLSIDNISVKMSKEEVKALQAKLSEIDAKVIKSSIALDLADLDAVKLVFKRDFASTDDVEDVMAKIGSPKMPAQKSKKVSSKVVSEVFSEK